MLRTGLVEERRRKNVKASWESHCPSGKRLIAGRQSCNIPPIYDDMVLKCPIYLFNKHIKCLGQF